MNMPLCISLMEAFRKDERVCFFIYTNGSTIDHIIPTFRRLKDQPFINPKYSKLTVQVSYDGNPNHDKNRLDKKGMGTSVGALHALAVLHKYGIDFGLKATMSWKDFDKLPECWDDFMVLHAVFGKKIRYALTVDYYDVEFSKYE
jgi:sulfatase maturation enzyme AslB (radical SAM superfamily)